MQRLLRISLFSGLLLMGTLCFPRVQKSLLPPLAEWLDVGENPGCVDYVMVLPGEETNRCLTAAALARAGLAQEVLIPENPLSADVKDGMTPPTAQLSRLILGHRGIADDRIRLIGSASRTTFDDAQSLVTFLGERNRNVAIVTSAFHTRRTRYIFQTVFRESPCDITFIAAPNPGFRTDLWWRQPEGMRLIVTEYLKLGFYYLRYGGIRLWGAVVACICCLMGCRLLMQRRRTRTAPA